MSRLPRLAAPPRVPRAILRALLAPDRFEAIDGDLLELFERRLNERGSPYAQWRYWSDAASVLARLHLIGAWRRRADRRLALPFAPFRYGLRALATRPAFSITALLTLGVGIGAVTTVFSVVRALTWHPEVALGHPDTVVVWGTNYAAGQPRDVVSGPTFLDLQRENQTLRGLSAFHVSDLTIRNGDRADVISTLRVTPDFFDVTGIRVAIGRGFEPADAREDAHVIILSDGLWRQQFGGDPSALGRTLPTGGQAYTVIGILPASFRFFDTTDAVTLIRPADVAAENRSYYFYWLVGRLREAVSPQRAEQDLNRIMSRIASEYPLARGWQITVDRLAAVLDEPVKPASRIALVAALLAMLVACANVGSLILTRHTSRLRELAVRRSLGASRSRIVFEIVAETAWLSAGGAVAGTAFAIGALAVLNRSMPPGVAIAESAGTVALPSLQLDGTALAVAAAVAIVTVGLCGLAPAWHASGREYGLASGSRGSTAGPSEHRARVVLLSFESALATMLLVVAWLLVQTVSRLNAVDPGFRGDGVVSMIVGRVDDLSPVERERYYTNVLNRASDVPGVVRASLNDYVLLTNEDDYEAVQIEGQPPLPSGQWPREEWRRVSDGYFQTLRIPIVSGRGFTPHDTAASESVAIVNQAMARKYWPSGDPVGRRIRLGAKSYGWSQVVGVVGDVREVGVDRPAKPMIFVPYHRAARPVMALFARLEADPQTAIPAIQRAVWSVDPTRPVFDLRRVDRLVADSIAVRVLTERVAGITALLALSMTAVGLFSVLSYSVSQRTREIGLRIAIGARRIDVVGLIVRQGARPVVAGVGTGMLAALWVASLAREQLYEVSPSDAPTYVLSAAALLVAALLSCAVPAIRAARVDPASALRSE